jgi:hypothetical protein
MRHSSRPVRLPLLLDGDEQVEEDVEAEAAAVPHRVSETTQ